MEEFIAEFVAETREMLQALECELVAWERDPRDRARLDAIFRFVHTVKGSCGFLDIPRLQSLAHAAEDALSDVRSGKRVADSALVGTVLVVIDRIAEMVDLVEIGGDLSQLDDTALIAALDGNAAAPAAVKDDSQETTPAAASQPSAKSAELVRTVRLPTGLVDQVMSGVSDMILVRNELERQIRESERNSGLETTFNRLSTILSDMQTVMARVRMQPIGNLFAGYQRMIRDLAAELGKQVEVEIESGQVEIDREMIELLRDPLLHIIRNAIDHGIESPEERKAKGKPATGHLLLSARQTGNEIRIGIIDDGKGIDGDRLVEKAVANGIITPAQAEILDAKQRNSLICEPGLSTAREITQISGRGVGMDVVRASVERIGGHLMIDSAPEMGCRIMLDVPLTLSIVPSITVHVGGQTFALPRSYVVEIVHNSSEIEADRIGGVRHVRVRGDLNPCAGLAEILGIEGHVEAVRQTLVMVKMVDGTVFALGVDGIAEHGDLVLRPVAPQVIDTGLYVGVAQLNDGRPALMIDVSGIARQAGIMVDVHGRSRFERSSDNQDEQISEQDAMIVFDAPDGLRKAVAMEHVDRLSEVAVDDVGYGGGYPHIVVDNAIVPLIGLQGRPEGESIEVLILSEGERRLAHATTGTVVTGNVDLGSATGPLGRQVALFEGRTVELLDLPGLLEGRAQPSPEPQLPSCRITADHAWSRDFLRPMVQAAGYRIVEDASGPVDLEIRFEDDQAPSSPGMARETIMIDAGTKSRKKRGTAIHRDDHLAIALALRTASQGGGR